MTLTLLVVVTFLTPTRQVDKSSAPPLQCVGLRRLQEVVHVGQSCGRIPPESGKYESVRPVLRGSVPPRSHHIPSITRLITDNSFTVFSWGLFVFCRSTGSDHSPSSTIISTETDSGSRRRTFGDHQGITPLLRVRRRSVTSLSLLHQYRGTFHSSTTRDEYRREEVPSYVRTSYSSTSVPSSPTPPRRTQSRGLVTTRGTGGGIQRVVTTRVFRDF